jgi:cytochrome c2
VQKISNNYDCLGCHTKVLNGGYDSEYPAERSSDWKRNLRHLTYVPGLIDLSKRMQRGWFVEYVQSPHVVRPNLHTEMPPMPIGKEEAELLGDYFFPERTNEDTSIKAFAAGDFKRGESLFREKECARCHLFNQSHLEEPRSVDFWTPAVTPHERRIAPDLRHTRKRMSHKQLIRWLLNPKSLKSDSVMPDFGFNQVEAIDLATYLLNAPLLESNSPLPLRTLTPATRPVEYSTLEKRLFKAMCWHCHSDPSYNNGDGGPGRTGGFGFTGADLSFASYEDTLRGGRQPDGSYRSILKPARAGEKPLIIEHLLARHREVRGEKGLRYRGMPMAIPPIPLEDIELLWGWIEQGAPR